MPERNNRRDVILDKAAQLFAAKGVAATTVREIADSVGLLSGSLYHHFESKDAIVDELLSSYLDDLRTRYHEVTRETLDPRTRIERLVHASMQVVEAHPYATEIYQNDFNLLRNQPRFGYLKSSAAETRKIWLDALNSGLESGAFRSDIDPQVLYRIIRDVVWLSVRWQKPGGGRSLTQLADECSSVLLDGIAAKAPARRRARAS
jgi:TetR/AcrR family transcriptional regulator, cholesterol catabolism regulator